MIHRVISIAVLASCLANPSAAEDVEADEALAVDFDEELDEVEIDVEGSIGDAEERRGIGVNGDLRVGYAYTGDDLRDVSLRGTDILRARWRIRSTLGLADNLRGVIRVAGFCSTEGRDPDFVLQPDTPTVTSLDDGQITIDSLFLHWFRGDRFDVAVGRMETKFVARGGVYSKSLDRNNSNNLRINWTDGIHGTFKARNGWESHVIVQYNSDDGPGSVSRFPLDFSSSKSRVSYFFGIENLQSTRMFIQRGFDITYMPSSLVVDGQIRGPVEDYWGIVARTASRWPVRSDDWRIRLSSEVGYAPNTPTGERLPGKIIWHDLLTSDPAGSKRFYGELFGWEFENVGASAGLSGDTAYTLIRHDGRLIGGMVDTKALNNRTDISQWVVLMSVDDIVGATRRFSDGGGSVLTPPRDLQRRGRIAVVRDAEGALLALLQTRDGDPPDREPELGGFLWDELWTTDVEHATKFYKDVAGFASADWDTVDHVESSSNYRLLKAGDVPRAGILANPLEGLSPVWVSYLRVENPAAITARVKELGGRVIVEARPRPLGGEVAFIAGPSGA